MPTLVVRYPDGSETEHELFGDLRIGRQDGNDLILTEGGVSRQHARIFLEGSKVLLEDLSSANGTYIDGERITDVVVLTSQTQVVLGDYELRIKGGGRNSGGSRRGTRVAEAPAADSRPRSTRAMPTLKPARPPGAGLAKAERVARNSGADRPVRGIETEPPPRMSMGGPTTPVLRGLTGPWANMIYPIKTKVVVGRVPPAVVLLEDDSISRKHAELERTGRGVMLRDLGSANGTLLNGERLDQEPVQLSPGDIVQFGMVELAYESNEQAGSALGRRAARGAAGRGRADDLDDAPPQRSRKLIGVAVAVVALVLVAGVAKMVITSPTPPSQPVDTGPVVVDPAEQVQRLLSECRSYTSKDMGSEPQWGKAEAKCEEARELDPINSEVNSEIKRIRIEREAAEYFAQGTKLLERLREEEAIDVLQKIPKESTHYWRRAKIKMDEAAEQVNKRAEDDCKRYLRDGQWKEAVPRCDRFMSSWCQKQSKEDLEPPLGYTLKLRGKVNKSKKEWQPPDKLFVQFLIARENVDPKVEPWTCKAGYGANVEEGDGPSVKVKKMFKERYPNLYLNAAMFDYWGGRANESVAKLQKVRSTSDMASLHNQADLLIKDVSNVANLFKAGSTELQAGEIEKAAEPFDEALEVDMRLMGELGESTPSFYRRTILQDIADKAYERGQDWVKREDPRRACRLWKIGFRFYKGNLYLNRVLSNVCSGQAAKIFAVSSNCSDLAAAEEWAVPGDGLDEKIAKKREELKCK